MSKNIKKIIHTFITKIDHSSHFYCDLFIKMIGFVLEDCAMTIMVEGECKYVEDFKGGNMTSYGGAGVAKLIILRNNEEESRY